jgi:hypothetical protein
MPTYSAGVIENGAAGGSVLVRVTELSTKKVRLPVKAFADKRCQR